MASSGTVNDDLKIITLIHEGDLEQLSTISKTWAQRDFRRFKEENLFPLHLAIANNSLELTKLFLSIPQIDINQQDQYGKTPLHTASLNGSVDLVNLLLDHPTIDDTILDIEDHDAIYYAKNDAVVTLIQNKRNQFVEENKRTIKKLVDEGNFEQILKIFSNPRVFRLVDINLQFQENGRTLLHEAALKNDTLIVEWLVQRDANNLIKDYRDNLPYDLATDPEIKAMLARVVVDPAKHVNKRIEGLLKKWTNLAGGFKERYFVLDQGEFSYYKNKDEVNKACRGSINMKSSQIHWKEDSTWFEVVGVGHLKFELKANHIVEAKQWVAALLEAKDFMENGAVNIRQKSLHSQGTWSKPKVSHLLRKSLTSSHRKRYSISTIVSQSEENLALPASPSLSPSMIMADLGGIDQDSNMGSLSDLENLNDGSQNLRGTLMSIETQADVQLRLIDSIVSKSSNQNLIQVPFESIDTLLASISSQKKLVQAAIEFDSEREAFWFKVSDQQLQKQTIWRNNLESLAQEHHQLETLLREQMALKKFQRAGKAVVAAKILAKAATVACEQLENSNSTKEAEVGMEDVIVDSGPDPELVISDSENEDFFDAEDNLNTSMTDEYNQLHLQQQETLVADQAAKQGNIDSGAEVEIDPKHDIQVSFAGYPVDGQFRDQLEMSGEVKADISIWSILKSSIGKDLSRISVPVEFNESTSMLQRMCEDMEYSTLLDIAVQQPEPLQRMLWVAAFAMSNYSSTKGRVGKPFNPLLGETFEYVRPDRQFRYISEQVSHHPPISACYCESPNYVFQAEVNLVSKFWGKSFELNPTGVTHLNLRLPKVENSELPHEDASTASNNLNEEHYSWTKVTSAMNNIIIGNMYIEHYGDMVITNHNTNDVCTLTFQRTGWRSSNKHVIRGIIKDSKGREVWEIGGRWDDKLVARRIGFNDGEDLVEKAEKCKIEDHTTSEGNRPILLWKMAPLPNPNIAYNLTTFAATLNQTFTELEPYLPPTDSRWRPDQKAMERGDFSFANDAKVQLEEQQRLRRKKQHQAINSPRWFEKTIDADTQSTLWRFNHQYWTERHRAGTEKISGDLGKWENVISIFE